MGRVHDAKGYLLGSVNAWGGVYDTNDRKVGSVNIFTSKVFDAEGNFMGKALSNGDVYDASGKRRCSVAFGSDIKHESGISIGSVGTAGTPEPMPNLQCRGAAALLLLGLLPPAEATTTLLDSGQVSPPNWIHGIGGLSNPEADLRDPRPRRPVADGIEFPAISIVSETIRQIEEAPDYSQKCWDITLEGADTLHFYAKFSIDGLVALLSNPDRKTVVLAMLYLGILNTMGLNATTAIEPIRAAAALDSSHHIIVVTTGIALAMLGQPDAVKAMASFMKQAGIPSVHEFNRGGIATVIRYIATGKEMG